MIRTLLITSGQGFTDGSGSCELLNINSAADIDSALERINKFDSGCFDIVQVKDVLSKFHFSLIGNFLGRLNQIMADEGVLLIENVDAEMVIAGAHKHGIYADAMQGCSYHQLLFGAPDTNFGNSVALDKQQLYFLLDQAGFHSTQSVSSESGLYLNTLSYKKQVKQGEVYRKLLSQFGNKSQTLRQMVKDYQVVVPLPVETRIFAGESAAEKRIVFNLFSDNTKDIQVLDIGFGLGHLGLLIKGNEGTKHWHVDGIDGYEVACRNSGLFSKKAYRNIWHGLAQDLGCEDIKHYDVICLLDVIEHLNQRESLDLLKYLLFSMKDDARLVISTPLWFYPQDQIEAGDLEEHQIGVPASSMVALKPLMYTLGEALVGTFVFENSSFEFVEGFKPTTDRFFDAKKGMLDMQKVGLPLKKGVVYHFPK